MEFISSFGILLGTVILLAYLWVKNKFNYWKKRNITTPPYSLIWGNMRESDKEENCVASRILNIYQTLKSKGLRHGGMYLFWKPIYVPIDLEIVKSIIQTDFQYFTDRGVYFNEKSDPLSTHLFTLGGKKWKILRSKLSPTFTSGKVKMMFRTLLECTTGLHKVMNNSMGNPIDIKDILGRFTTDIIISCAFGLNCDSLKNPENEFRKQGKAVFQLGKLGNLKQLILALMPELMKKFDVISIPRDVSKFFLGVVKTTVAYREKNNIFRKDFMHLLIQLKNRGKLVDDEGLDGETITEAENTITLEEIAGQAFLFFLAGFETSSTTMTFCLYELAINKNIQNKARSEIKKVLSKHNNQLTYEAAADMHYLEQTINETLRKYPPFPSLQRKCNKPYIVPGTDFVLDKGTMVFIPLVGIQNDPEFFPDPEKFDPDRFSDENKKTRPDFTFFPFGEGPRICIGARFGMMQTKVGLVALLLNYEFTVNEKTILPLEFDPENFTTSTKGGMWLDFEKISDETVQMLPETEGEM